MGRSIVVRLLLALTAACGSSQAPDPAPAGPPGGAAAAPKATGHLHIAPFKVVFTDQSGARREMSGDASGNLTLVKFDRDGKESSRVQDGKVSADGQLSFQRAGLGTREIRADGTLVVDGEPTAIRVAEDGTVIRDGVEILKIEGEKVVDVSPDRQLLGAVSITVEADAATRRLASYLLFSSAIVSRPAE